MFDDTSHSASALPIGELVDAIAEESGQIAAAQCQMLLKLAEFDAREDAAFAWDCKSAAHWLSGRCGYDLATSWEMLRVARRLRELPAVTEAFGKGQLSYPAVRALVRIATAETEADMVEMARVATGEQLGRVVASYRRVLAAGTGEGEHCEVEDGPEIAPETACRLACDAAVVSLVENASGEVLSMGRKTRKISPAMARALRCRDKGCVFPGCGETRFVQGHHITHWAQGGETSLENLTQLCWFHHHLIHEGGFGLVKDSETRALVFSRPDGRVIDRVRVETG